jgi:hypothetical protein
MGIEWRTTNEMKKITLKTNTDLYEELKGYVKIGETLIELGEKLRDKSYNVLSTFATYGVEVPEKRIKKLIKNNDISRKQVEVN